MRIFDPKLTGSIEFLNPVRGGFTGSIFGSSSYALTASYALNGGTGGSGNITVADEGTSQGTATFLNFTGNAVTATVSANTASLTISTGSNSLSSSFADTASFLNNLNQNLSVTGSVRLSGSATTELFVLGDQEITGSLKITNGVTAQSFTGSISASSLQGSILNSQLQNSSVTVGSTAISLGGSATTIAGVVSLTSTNITGSIISASNFISGGQIIAATGFTGSLSASFLKGAILNTQLQNSSVTVGSTNISLGGTSTTLAGLSSVSSTSLTGSLTASSISSDLILGTQTKGQYASTIAGGAGLTATAAGADDGTAYTIDAVAGAGISLTAPTNDAINIDTGSAHFTGGVTNRLNSSNVLSGSVSSPSQGTISVGGFTNIDLGLQTNDNVTFNNITSTGNVVIQGNLTAQQFIVSSSVYFTTTSFSSGSTIFGNSLDDTHQFTGSLRVLGSITGSISASNLVGAITNAQLQNSSVTVGTTAISLGGSATTIAGIASLTATNITASIVSSSDNIIAYNLTSSFGIRTQRIDVTVAADFADGNEIRFGNSDDVRFRYNGTSNQLEIEMEAAATALKITDNNIVDRLVFEKSTGNLSVSGSIFASGGFTGSLLGTSSFVTGSIFSGTNLALSASNAITASYVRNLYISASETANASPTPNELWYDASTGKTYIRYRSGSNEAWVLQSDPTIDVTTSLQTLQEVTDLGSTTTNAVAITNTTNAIDSASGALIVSGGAGFRLDVRARKFYGDGSGLTGVTATYTETDTLQTVTTRGNETSASVFYTNTTNATSKTVGALRVSGGLGVEQDIFAERVRATSFTGSLFGTSSFATTASYALNAAAASSFPFTGSAIISGSLTVTGSVNVDRGVTGSLLGTASYALTASFLLGGGSQVNIQEEGSSQGSAGTLNFVGTSVTAAVAGGTATITITGGSGASDFPYTGSAIISGSLIVTGSSRILADGLDGFEAFGNVNDYFEIFAQNRNSGISASSDIVAYNDQGTKTQNYVDMGINSSGISPTYSFGKANDAYVYNTGGDLFIGNSTAFYQPTRTSQSLHLFANGPGIPDLTITGSRIGIQKSSSLNAALDVIGNVMISGALHITGSAAAELKVLGESEFTGSVKVTNGIIAQSITASLQGSASYAITASYALNGGGAGGNSFETIAVAGQSDVVAESATDTLTFVAGSGMTITTDAGTDTITFNSPAPNIYSRGITIADPTNAEDATIMFTTASLTINRLAAVIRGTTTPGVTFTLRYAATRSLTGTEVITGGTRVNTTGSALISSSGFTNATVPADNFVWLETTNISGSVSELFVQFYY